MEKGKNGKKLKAHHHVLLDSEFKFDCNVWRLFLTHFRDSGVCRPMIDIKNTNTTFTVQQLNFAFDASKNTRIGMGMIFNNQWAFAQWEPGYIEKYNSSIEYLELLGVVAAISHGEINSKTSG